MILGFKIVISNIDELTGATHNLAKMVDAAASVAKFDSLGIFRRDHNDAQRVDEAILKEFSQLGHSNLVPMTHSNLQFS